MIRLQLTKVEMHDLFYNKLKTHYGHNVHLLYSDTDSLIMIFTCQDIHEEMRKTPLKDAMDFSSFDKESPLYDDARRGQLGLVNRRLVVT